VAVWEIGLLSRCTVTNASVIVDRLLKRSLSLGDYLKVKKTCFRNEELEKLPSVKDRGQTARVTTPTRARLRRYRWPRPSHDARLAALARS